MKLSTFWFQPVLSVGVGIGVGVGVDVGVGYHSWAHISSDVICTHHHILISFRNSERLVSAMAVNERVLGSVHCILNPFPIYIHDFLLRLYSNLIIEKTYSKKMVPKKDEFSFQKLFF